MLACLLSAPVPALSDDWEPLVARLGADGYDEVEMRALFARAELRHDPAVMARKLNGLLRARQGLAGEEGADFGDYLLAPVLLAEAVSFMQEHAGLLVRVGSEYGVPPEVQTAILLVESRLGQRLGESPALVVLANLSSCDDWDAVGPLLEPHPEPLGPWILARCREKAAWGYAELKALLDHARSLGRDPLSITGSPFGAVGLPQFMPSNIDAYGADGDGDGVVDLFVVPDALASVSKFLRDHGWKPKMDDAARSRVLLRYNRSQAYVDTVTTAASVLSPFAPEASPAPAPVPAAGAKAP